MKKVLFAMLIALTAMACQKEPGEIVYPEPDKGVSYVLEGVVATEGFEWSESAIIGLYSMNTAVKAANLECKIEGWVAPVVPGEDEEETPEGGEVTPEGGEATLAAYAAEVPANAKRFITPAMDLVKGENKFMVYYPYDAGLTYVMGRIYGLNVSASQVQTVPNVAAECFSLGTAVGAPKVDETFKFTMNPVTALAQVKVTSTEFANYGVKKVTIWNNDDVAISGGFNVDVNNMTFENLPNATPNKAAVTVTNPSLLSATKTQNVYVNLLPSDLTGKDMWLLVELEGPQGGVTLPIKKAGVKFEAGKTTLIDLSNLSLADNAAGEWYVPTESRLLGGLGYAYGEANTFLIQCKNGKTYTNGTYTPNADIPNEVKIDIRPRGNFAEVVDPKGATFAWFRKGVAVDGNGTGAVWGQGSARMDDLANPTTDGAYTFEYDGNYTVTVKNNSAYAGAPILLMIKDGKILWAWYFWNISADGTTLEGIDVGNGTKLANMLIGQHTTQFAAWGSNLQKGQTTAYAPGFAYVVHYQWGRYVPALVWTHWWSIDDHTTPEAPAEGGTKTNGNASVIRTSQPVSLKFAMEHPVGLFTSADLDGPPANGKKMSTEFNNWSSDTYGDLWGNCGESNEKTDYVGTKSIYDPCPKGWRIADAATFAYMEANGSFAVCDNADTNYKAAPGMVYNNTLHLLNAGYSRGVFTGDFRLASEGGGPTHDNKNGCTLANTWSNLVPGPSAAQPYMLIQDNKVPKHTLGTGGRSKAAPVRCQVDTDNR